MATALLSPHWYRVAALKPRLRAGVRVARHRVRGETWVVLTDPLAGRQHRFDALAWSMIAGCDGTQTLDELWSRRAREPEAPTQDEALAIVAQAFESNLLLAEISPEADAVMRQMRRRRRQRRMKAVNPLAFRVPLWDPDAFLGRHVPKVAWLFHPLALAAMAAVVLLGAIAALANAAALAEHARALSTSTRYWLLLWLLYPVVKGMHELAHGFTLKRFGGEVRAFGVSLLMVTPVPYVDASSSAALAAKGQRAAVAAAGIVTELVLASMALLAWWALEPGLARDAAMAVLTLAGLSTLLVNGNPLLRFDGYHVATDLLELPNLATRSTAWWRAHARRIVLGVRQVRPPRPAAGEAKWLWLYAPLSWAMQLVLLAAGVAMLAAWNGYVALAMLALALWFALLGPAWRTALWIARAPELHGTRARAGTAALAGAVLAVLALVAWPLPHRTHAPGLVWLPEEALVRVATEGFVETFAAADGAELAAGALIARLRNDALVVQRESLATELDQLQVERGARFASDALATTRAADRIEVLEAELARLDARLAALELRAAHAGRLVLDPQRRLPGMFLKQGELLGHLLPGAAQPPQPVLVRAYVHNDHLIWLTHPALRGEVAWAHGGAAVAAKRIVAQPQATKELASPVLGESYGGAITVELAGAGTGKGGAAQATEPRMRVDLELPPGTPAPVGARTLVTFEHGQTTPIDWLVAQLRRLFLRHVPG